MRFAFTRTVYLLQGQYLQLVVINVFILRYSLTGGHHNGGWGIFSWRRKHHELSLRWGTQCYVFAVYFNKTLQIWTNYKHQWRRHLRDAWHCVFFGHQTELRSQVFVSQEYNRVAPHVVCSDSVPFMVSPITVFVTECPLWWRTSMRKGRRAHRHDRK